MGFLASSGIVINRKGARISPFFSRGNAVFVTVENGKGAEGHAGGGGLAGMGRLLLTVGFDGFGIGAEIRGPLEISLPIKIGNCLWLPRGAKAG